MEIRSTSGELHEAEKQENRWLVNVNFRTLMEENGIWDFLSLSLSNTGLTPKN